MNSNVYNTSIHKDDDDDDEIENEDQAGKEGKDKEQR
jgi:hypothetical protein